MTNREQAIIDLMSHFHKESSYYGGWSIFVDKQKIDIVKNELKGALKILKFVLPDGSPVEKGKNVGVLAELKSTPKWNPKYEAMMFKDERDMYREAEGKLYDGIKALVK